MKRGLVYSPEAVEDLEEIFWFIAADNARRARTYIEEIRKACTTDEAKAVCRRCSVTESCLQWAIESGQDAGVWGGMSEDERRALKRRNRQRARTA